MIENFIERRKHKRYQIIVPVEFCLHPYGEVFKGNTVNISERGVLIESVKMVNDFKINDNIWVRFRPDQPINCTFIAQVKSIINNRVGICLQCTHTEKEMMEFLRIIDYAKFSSGEGKINKLAELSNILGFLEVKSQCQNP
jgi:hypothetical protein